MEHYMANCIAIYNIIYISILINKNLHITNITNNFRYIVRLYPKNKNLTFTSSLLSIAGRKNTFITERSKDLALKLCIQSRIYVNSLKVR